MYHIVDRPISIKRHITHYIYRYSFSCNETNLESSFLPSKEPEMKKASLKSPDSAAVRFRVNHNRFSIRPHYGWVEFITIII